MKKFICLLIVVALSDTLKTSAQTWMEMMDNPHANFYEVQKEFYKWHDAVKNNEENERVIQKSFNEESETVEDIYYRWEYFNKSNIDASGNILPLDASLKAWQEYKSINPSVTNQLQGTWTSLGPTSWTSYRQGPGIGRTNTVVVDPSDSNNVYVGVGGGGLWKSTDGGNTWSPKTDSIAVLGASSIVVDPQNSSTIYFIAGGNRILKSTDGANSWTQLIVSSAPVNENFNRLIINPANGQNLFCQASTGMYKSIDGGLTWSFLNGVGNIKFKPGNSGIIYAVGYNFLRSTDGGITFNTTTNSLPNTELNIDVTAADSNYVYILSYNTTNFLGLYLSTDGGDNFTLQSNSPNLLGSTQPGNGSDGVGFNAMAVSQTNKNQVCVGAYNAWVSNDAGISWNITSFWKYGLTALPYVHTDFRYMASFGGSFWICCDGGIFKTEDGGTTWLDKTTGMSIAQCLKIGASSSNPNMIMYGGVDNGCNVLTNGQCLHVHSADGFEVIVDPTDTLTIYSEQQYGVISRSDNGGVTDIAIATTFQGINESGGWYCPYTLNPQNHNTLYTARNNIWKSENKGDSWTKISNFDPTIFPVEIEVAPSDSNYIYTSSFTSVTRTTDGGSTWDSLIIQGVINSPVTDIAIDPNNPDRAWAVCSGNFAMSKVYYTPDGGITWINISQHLPNTNINCIVYKNNSPDGLYIGTSAGVFYKDSTLSTWQPFNAGLPFTGVSEVEINYLANKIRAGTFGRGVWESDMFIPNQTPVADFYADPLNVCPNEPIQFYDNSFNNGTSFLPVYHWSFIGGSPASSTIPNPIVSYPADGVYDVSLHISNVNGADSITRAGYIIVQTPATITAQATQGFEAIAFPPSDWRIFNPDQFQTWEKGYVGGYGLSSTSTLHRNCKSFTNNPSDILLSPPYDLNTLSSPTLFFDRAYGFDTIHVDTLKVFYSFDCGLTRNYFYSKSGYNLSTSITPYFFIPADSQWVTESISLSFLSSFNNVQFGFEFVTAGGGNIFLDNINLASLVSVGNTHESFETVSVFPNPTNNELNIQINSSEVFQFTLYNSLGEKIIDKTLTNKISVIDLSVYSSGLYFYKLISDKNLMKSGNIIKQ